MISHRYEIVRQIYFAIINGHPDSPSGCLRDSDCGILKYFVSFLEPFNRGGVEHRSTAKSLAKVDQDIIQFRNLLFDSLGHGCHRAILVITSDYMDLIDKFSFDIHRVSDADVVVPIPLVVPANLRFDSANV